MTTLSSRQEILDLAQSQDLASRGIQAIVLFGSRAKGTHRDDSDWDLAFLVDRPGLTRVEPLHSYWQDNPFQEYEDVDGCVLSVPYFQDHMYHFGQLSHQIARDGQPLLGPFQINRETLETMTHSRPEDWNRYLGQSYISLIEFFNQVQNFKKMEDHRLTSPIGNTLVRRSQEAAEFLVKGIAIRRYIDPRKSHDIALLAQDMRTQKPRGIDPDLWFAFVQRIQALDGFTLKDSQAAYEGSAPDVMTLQRACLRIERTLMLFGDEVASAQSVPQNPAGMGLSPKSLGDHAYRDGLFPYAAAFSGHLHALFAQAREILAAPNTDKGPLGPYTDVGGMVTLPTHLAVIQGTLETLSLQRNPTPDPPEKPGEPDPSKDFGF